MRLDTTTVWSLRLVWTGSSFQRGRTGVSGVAMTITPHRITRKLPYVPSNPLSYSPPAALHQDFSNFELLCYGCDDKRPPTEAYLLVRTYYNFLDLTFGWHAWTIMRRFCCGKFLIRDLGMYGMTIDTVERNRLPKSWTWDWCFAFALLTNNYK